MDEHAGGGEITAVPPVARVGDRTTCPKSGHSGGVIVEGSPRMYANDRPVARVGDTIACGCGTTDTIVTGAPMLEAEDGRPVARVGSRTAHGGTVVTGSPTVFAGDGGPGSPQARALWAAARASLPYAHRCDGGSDGGTGRAGTPADKPVHGA